ncbi:pilin [Patescibacteria group bacterium]
MNIKKQLKSVIIVFTLVSVALGMKMLYEETTFAQSSLQKPLETIQSATDLPTFDTNTHSKASIQPGASNITSAIFFVLDFAKYLIGTVAVVVIIIAGVKLVMARKKIDEVWPKQKEHLIMIATGLIFIFVADVAVRNVFFGVEGEVYDTQAQAEAAAEQGIQQLRGMYNVVMILAGAIAVFMLIVAGIRLITSGGNEEVQTKVKKQITWIVIGLFVIGVAEFAVMDFIFPKHGTQIPDDVKGRQLIVDFTNFISAFISIAAVIACIYGGYLYVTAVGNEEQTGKAKKTLVGAIIALVIALGAFAIINTVVQIEPGL